MDLSIIILNYNQKNLLKQCLRNIKEANLNLDYEIIVVDNASTDGSRELLLTLNTQNQKLKIILNKKNLGFTKGNNCGIVAAKGKYLLILNPDVIVLPGSIEKIYQFMEEHPQIAVVGPRLLNPDKTVQLSCRRFPNLMMPIYRRTLLGKLPWAKKSLAKYLMEDFDHLKNREVDWLLGACLMVRKEAIEKVGLMDERYFLFFQDIDWCRRFWLAGWQVFYLAEAKMFHFHQRPSAQKFFNRLTWIHILDGCKYFWRWSFLRNFIFKFLKKLKFQKNNQF